MFLLRWVRRVGILKVGIAVGLAIAPLSANEQQEAQLNNREATTVALDNAGGYLSPRQIRTRARNAIANTAKPTVRRSANASANTVRAVLWKRPSAKGRDALSRTSFSRGPVPGLLFEAISVRASKRPYCHIIHSKGRATAAGRLPIESQYRYL